MKAVQLSKQAPVQSVTADFYDEEDRGKVFGTLHLTSAAGAAFGGLYATNMGDCSMLHACHTAVGRLTVSTASNRLYQTTSSPYSRLAALHCLRIA